MANTSPGCRYPLIADPHPAKDEHPTHPLFFPLGSPFTSEPLPISSVEATIDTASLIRRVLLTSPSEPARVLHPASLPTVLGRQPASTPDQVVAPHPTAFRRLPAPHPPAAGRTTPPDHPLRVRSATTRRRDRVVETASCIASAPPRPRSREPNTDVPWVGGTSPELETSPGQMPDTPSLVFARRSQNTTTPSNATPAANIRSPSPRGSTALLNRALDSMIKPSARQNIAQSSKAMFKAVRFAAKPQDASGTPPSGPITPSATEPQPAEGTSQTVPRSSDSSSGPIMMDPPGARKAETRPHLARMLAKLSPRSRRASINANRNTMRRAQIPEDILPPQMSNNWLPTDRCERTCWAVYPPIKMVCRYGSWTDAQMQALALHLEQKWWILFGLRMRSPPDGPARQITSVSEAKEWIERRPHNAIAIVDSDVFDAAFDKVIDSLPGAQESSHQKVPREASGLNAIETTSPTSPAQRASSLTSQSDDSFHTAREGRAENALTSAGAGVIAGSESNAASSGDSNTPRSQAHASDDEHARNPQPVPTSVSMESLSLGSIVREMGRDIRELSENVLAVLPSWGAERLRGLLNYLNGNPNAPPPEVIEIAQVQPEPPTEVPAPAQAPTPHDSPSPSQRRWIREWARDVQVQTRPPLSPPPPVQSIVGCSIPAGIRRFHLPPRVRSYLRSAGELLLRVLGIVGDCLREILRIVGDVACGPCHMLVAFLLLKVADAIYDAIYEC